MCEGNVEKPPGRCAVSEGQRHNRGVVTSAAKRVVRPALRCLVQGAADGLSGGSGETVLLQLAIGLRAVRLDAAWARQPRLRDRTRGRGWVLEDDVFRLAPDKRNDEEHP